LKTPEGKIKNQIRKWLHEQGAYVFSPVQMGYGVQMLDLLVCWKGNFIAIEVKAPDKKLTARQAVIAADIRDAGGRAIVAHSLQDVVDTWPVVGWTS
jgi:hypothetical protein